MSPWATPRIHRSIDHEESPIDKKDRSVLNAAVSKGERTRTRIVEQAAGLFNRFGYGSTPVSALMEETGLKKGGLYNHFPSKEGLAIEAFRRNAAAVGAFLVSSVEGVEDPLERLRLLCASSLEIAEGKVVAGGCPVLNAAVEADDALPPLRTEAAKSAERLRSLLQRELLAARGAGLLVSRCDPDALSQSFLAAIEGGIMLSRLHGRLEPLRAVLQMLESVVDGLRPEFSKRSAADG